MATASITYTFVNSTAADADEVNQNFSDVVTFLNSSVLHTDGSKALTGNLSAGSNKITNLSAPTASTDAANKAYVDSAVPAGTIVAFAGSAAPSGWALCDGSTYPSASYPLTYAAIGTTYGGTVANFAVPNLKGKFPVGRDGADAPFDTLGETGGSKDAVAVAHTHPHTHGIDHDHGPESFADGDSFWKNTGITGTTFGFNSDGSSPPFSAMGTGDATVSVNLANFVGDSSGVENVSQSPSASATNANLPPFIVLNYIIRMA